MANSNFVDTGQWRLVISISSTEMTGMLCNVTSPDTDPLLMFHRQWEAGNNILKEVETTVYDNPRILDDFATHIIVTAPKTLWIPSDLTEDEEYDPKSFTAFYDALPDDIFTDFLDEEVCLYSLASGLGSFLSRTLPGSRISSHLTVLKEFYSKSAANGNNIFVDLRSREADILLFMDGRFTSAATHPIKDVLNLEHYLQILCYAYDVDIPSVRLTLCGEGESKILSSQITLPFRQTADLPSGSLILEDTEISHSMAIAGNTNANN